MVSVSLLTLPILVLVWVIEAYIFLSAARFVISMSPKARQSHLYGQLKLLTDPLPIRIGQYCAKWKKASLPSWLSWLIVISGGCVARQILMSMMLFH